MNLTPAATARLAALSVCERLVLDVVLEAQAPIPERVLFDRAFAAAPRRWHSPLQLGTTLHSLRVKLRGSGVMLFKVEGGLVLSHEPPVARSSKPAYHVDAEPEMSASSALRVVEGGRRKAGA